VKRAVVLLSGGIDSATTLAIAKKDGYELFALSFRYGQRHQVEVTSAQQDRESRLGVNEHRVMEIDLRAIGGSALTDAIDVPKNRSENEISRGIPITYVPARNTIFLSYALAWAEVIDAQDIFIGVNALDYSGYPDCRPEFILQFEKLARLATKTGVEGKRYRVHAPLIDLTKAQIIAQGAKLGVQFSLTTSCYDPAADGAACGECDSCLLRAKGFREAGIPDPTRYALRSNG
jgi:7-cyano-7-deazaguanine synthase